MSLFFEKECVCCFFLSSHLLSHVYPVSLVPLSSSSSVWMQSSSFDHLKNLSSCAALYAILSQIYTSVCVDVDASSDSLSVIDLRSFVKPGIAPTSSPVPRASHIPACSAGCRRHAKSRLPREQCRPLRAGQCHPHAVSLESTADTRVPFSRVDGHRPDRLATNRVFAPNMNYAQNEQ